MCTIHEAAETEINEAADFYDLRNPGLGTTFIEEVRLAIERIAEFPEAASHVRGRVRKNPMRGFPYSLVYAVRPDEIRILAVAHHSRRPFYWRGRQ
ncbi:MAG: type II toxin-antitoxin system RelE/ParE family toxin [Thermodesulfobacteriota bacterium]